MEKQAFTFGGNSGMSYEEMKRRRAIAQSMIRANNAAPKNVGEGLHAVGRAIAARNLNKTASKAEKAGMAAVEAAISGGDPAQAMISPYANAHQKKIAAELLKRAGVPGYRKGTENHPGGPAVVGEDGPELLFLPEGSQVEPGYRKQVTPPVPLPDEVDPDFDGRSLLPQQEAYRKPEQPQSPPPVDPTFDGRTLFDLQRETRFDDGNAYRTADMSSIPPSGVGETNQLHATARAFQGMMKSLDDYERLFADGGSTMWPGARKDALDVGHRDLQMQMKELYNLGVLNGPDLDLMNQILLSPTSIGGNIMDAVGISDMEKRIPANIEQVRQLMRNRSEPGLQQLGINMDDLMPAAPNPANSDVSAMSDEDLLKFLTGGN